MPLVHMKRKLGVVAIVAFLSVVVLSTTALPTNAQLLDEQTISYIYHYFTDVDGVNVSSHYATSGTRLTNNVMLAFQWGHDVVVFPAIDAPPGSQDAVDAITTASRPISATTNPYEDFVKIRNEFQGSVSYQGFKASYYTSRESDYYAQMVTGAYSHGFLEDNLTLSGAVSYSWDDIQPLDDNDTATADDFRKTVYWNLVATQIVTPTTVVRVGVETNYVSGLQHVPYRNVYVAGSNVPELHPRNRDRKDIFLNVSQYITNRSSLKFDYRFYTDDWGIDSHVFGGKLSQYVSEELVIRYRYRYYTQAAAYFFSDSYLNAGGIQGYQTGDYRLGKYGAHLFGGQLMWFPYRLLGTQGFLQRANLLFSYERYFNSNNFSADVYETGLRISF